MNGIYLRRKGKVYISPGAGGVGAEHLAVVQKEAEQLGFVFDEAVLARLSTLDVEQLTKAAKALLKELQTLTGAHRVMAPLYPDFPAQVIALSEAELYLNAVTHYVTLRRLAPSETDRPPLLHGRAPREIGLGSLEEFEGLFVALTNANASLSDQDKADVDWFIRQYRERIFGLLPARVPFKENLAFVGATLLAVVPGAATWTWLEQRLDTATDVLRLAVAINGGDVSLAKPTRFKSLPRGLRKTLLGFIEASAAPVEDMLRWPERWKRLGEVLHPREHAARYPRAAAAFATIREGRPVPTFNSQVEGALRDGHPDIAAALLASRPGELARRMDHLLRSAPGAEAALHHFEQVVSRVPTPLLLQMMTHFRRRGAGSLRAFFPKGQVAKVYAMLDARAPLAESVGERVAQLCERALLERFSALPGLGACYVDPRLREHLVPFSQRSTSRSLRTLVRGSRVPLPESNFLRLFLWWMNGKHRTDVDLSAVLFDSKYAYVDAVAYYNLKNYGGCHSGDIVDAPKGAAEFIDLDIQRLVTRGVRFVVMVLNSYTLQPYCDLPECFSGWMARRDVNSGEVFEARTVEDRVDIASDTRVCLPVAFDLEQRRAIWLDVALKESPRLNNARNNLTGVSLMLRAVNSLVKPDLFTLFSLHAQARGALVDVPEQAAHVFSIDRGLTPFDTKRIQSEFM